MTPLCHLYTAALITGRAVDMNGLGCQPRDTGYLANMGEAIPCIGSRCVKWCRENRIIRGTDGLNTSEYSGTGYCVDNPRNIFADPNHTEPR